MMNKQMKYMKVLSQKMNPCEAPQIITDFFTDLFSHLQPQRNHSLIGRRINQLKAVPEVYIPSVSSNECERSSDDVVTP